jgi:hypothetical protein
MSIPCCATPNQTLTSALLIAAVAIAAISGLGLLAAAFGIGEGSGWRSRWAIWLPSVFGISLAVGALSFVLLLASGID